MARTPEAGFTIRPGVLADEAFVVQLADRMEEFPLPAWRNRGELAAALRPLLQAAVHGGDRDGVVMVAEDAAHGTLGCVLVREGDDAVSGRPHARVEVLVVEYRAEARGVGGALLEAAEAWARARGLRRLVFDVFHADRRGAQWIERQGFMPDTVRYTKPL